MKRNSKDSYYFSHDSNARNDDKCAQLIEDMGLEGYGAFWILVEVLRDQSKYSYRMNLLSSLARKYNTTEELLKDLIQNYNLFAVFNDDDGISRFYSPSLTRRMEFVDKKLRGSSKGGLASAAKREQNDKKLKQYEQLLNLSSAELEQKLESSSTALQQSKVK